MQKLFVGLGNPGAEYANHRHNVGFMALDRMHARWRGSPWRFKFAGEVADAVIGDVRVLLLKPTTYMNESGRSVAEAARFYKIDPSDIVAMHDEIDLPPGRFRMKTGGGTGGHNGLRSLSAHLKDGFRRLRIGVGHPGRKEAVPGYVLHDFAKAEHVWLGPLLDALAEEAMLLAAGKDNEYASKVHLRLDGSGAAVSDGAARRAARRTAAAAGADAGAADTRPDPGAEAGRDAPAAAPADSRAAPAEAGRGDAAPAAAPAAGSGSPFASLAALLRRER